MKVAIETLGCKVNQYETQAMEQTLRARGHEIVPFTAEADAYVVNTCSVTTVGDQKSRQCVHRARREHPAAVVAVCGCYVQTHTEQARTLGADLIAGTGDRMGFISLLERAAAEKARTADNAPAASGSICPAASDDNGARAGGCACADFAHPDGAAVSPDMSAGADFGAMAHIAAPASTGPAAPLEAVDDSRFRRKFELLPAGGLATRTRAMLKVEDGCVNFCSYCIIPYARGPVRSAPLREAAAQAVALAAEGYREIVVTGIEISSWGRDLPGEETLIDLLEAICTAAPEVRIRLGSLEPRTVTEDFCRRCAALPNLCPQFHLSMQSGCDATLKRMNRNYDTARYFRSVQLLRDTFRRPAITTDLIVGFPEETEEEFAQSLAFLHRCAFAQMHVFPYSIRPGTPAAKMEQVPKAVKEERARRAGTVAEKLHGDYLAGCVGSVYPVLFEQPKGGLFCGHAPNYMEVRAPGAELHNALRLVRITGVDNGALLGEILEEK